MITYGKGVYGLNLVSRVHGSAVYKAFIPGIFSVGFYSLLQWFYEKNNLDDDDLDHPYAIGVLVSSVSFLIIFRANNSYQRYWESCGAVHHMMSKFLDATVHMAAFHMQCSHYKKIKPPVFFDHPEFLKYKLTRDRPSMSMNNVDKNCAHDISIHSAISINSQKKDSFHSKAERMQYSIHNERSVDSTPLLGPGRMDGGWNKLFEREEKDEPYTLNYEKRNASDVFGDTPSMFLKELSHLSSLLVAVAFSTLKDGDGRKESLLGCYEPGSDFPSPDPDSFNVGEKENTWSTLLKTILFPLGFDRTPYNEARPLLVVGGISENELKLLRKARGASAKTTLAWYWLSEFISREHLAGSSGPIAPPIISRLFQFLSDGMIYYNHGRKIMYIPFPFPHAQLSAIFVLVIVLAVPFMMNQYANERWLGSILTFLLVTCLSGLHEVGRELENPFQSSPNEVPLCSLLAMYNESLIAMCSGFHPDAYWEDSINVEKDEQFCDINTSISMNEQTKREDGIVSSDVKKIMEKQARELQELRLLIKESNLENV